MTNKTGRSRSAGSRRILLGLVRHAASAGNARSRLVTMIAFYVLVFTVIAARMVDLAIVPQARDGAATAGTTAARIARPDIVDRNGLVLATDIETASLHANPRKIIDVDEAVEKLAAVLPSLTRAELRKKLTGKGAFAWIKRELSPREQSAVHRLGIPGLAFRTEMRRVYPNGRLAAHVLGHVNVDNKGTGGMEKFIDRAGLTAAGGRREASSLAPVRLSIDLRVQHALTRTLSDAIETYGAKASMGAVVNVRTGELLAMASLPDFNPNEPAEALKPDRLNRMAAGVYEPGSTLKMVTVAMALDEGIATLESRYDAREPLRVGRHTINDFHAQRRILTVREIFTHSSNIGAAKIARDTGIVRHKAFLRKLGLLSRLNTELPESGAPLVPRNWKEINGLTIGFGHGLSMTPLQLMAAGVALVNGGRLLPLTFRPRDEIQALSESRQVVSAQTSERMRRLMKQNVESGTAGRARVAGYSVGGKTGTAEKVVNGRYSRRKLLTSFFGIVPAEEPEYAVLVMLDEPQRSAETHGQATSGWNAVPTAGKLIRRIAPMLELMPRLDRTAEAAPLESAAN